MLYFIQKAYVAALSPGWKDFLWHSKNLQKCQRKKIKDIISENKNTAFGSHYKFNSIKDIGTFQSLVPVASYEDFTPWIERICKGEERVLTHAPVRIFERTGGSTATNKIIPYTSGLLTDFSRATCPWMHDLFQNIPALYGTRSYWSISPVARSKQKTESGIPIGFEDDAEYFGPVTRWGLRKMQAVSPRIARLESVEEWREHTLLALLGCENLGFLSVWSPTFLALLMQALESNLSYFINKMPVVRRNQIEYGLNVSGAFVGEALWPNLSLVSCWTQGASAHFLPELLKFFPRTLIQGKGLLATEGVVSIPLMGTEGSVLAARSHFFEFLDLAHPNSTPLLAHELKVGGEYSPILTTSGGFYRYHLKDIVTCTGHFGDLPLFRYDGKLDRVSDLCGEKINARQVEKALEIALAQLNFAPVFAMLAPVLTPAPHYCLYVEADASNHTLQLLSEGVESYLVSGHHYSYCRDLGQLGGVQWQRVENGMKIFHQTLVNQGIRAGDIKPTRLETRLVWKEAFRK